ncbi:MAG: trigger factor [Planctomycetota bacterium]|nr:trigger factor [Planctomycetota bacterium]
MQVTVEKLGPCQAKIHFTVPSPEFQALYKRGLTNVSQNANMKGFRPGKVPPQILEKQFGAQVKNDAIEHFVRQAYEQAVGENELKIVGFQRVNLDEVKILEGVDWQQSFEVSLRPDITLGDYKGVAIESELEPVMDPDITQALDSLKMQQARPEPAGEQGAPADGMIVGKIQWLHGDNVVLEREGLRLSPKTATPGTDAQAFEAALVGAQDGTTVDIDMTFPAEIDKEELKNQKGITRVHVAQAYKMILPTEDELMKLFGAETREKMLTNVRGQLEIAKQNQENARVESAILERLLEKHAFELPTMMVDEQSRARTEAYKAQIKEQGANDAQIEAAATAYQGEAREKAEKGLRALFLIQTIGEKEKLLVTREDMEAELKSIADRNRTNIDEVRKYYQEKRLFDQMAVELLERKVRGFLRENAKITTPA